MSIPFTLFNPHLIAAHQQEMLEAVQSVSTELTETERQQLLQALRDLAQGASASLSSLQVPEFDFRQLLSESTGSQPCDQERPDGEAKSHGDS